MKINLKINLNKTMNPGDRIISSGWTHEKLNLGTHIKEKIREISKNKNNFFKHIEKKLKNVLDQADIIEVAYLNLVGKNFWNANQILDWDNLKEQDVLKSLVFIFKYKDQKMKELKLRKNTITITTNLKVKKDNDNQKIYFFDMNRMEILSLPFEKYKHSKILELEKPLEVIVDENNFLNLVSSPEIIKCFIDHKLKKIVNIFDETSPLKIKEWSHFVYSFHDFLDSKKKDTHLLFLEDELTKAKEINDGDLFKCFFQKKSGQTLSERQKYIFSNINDPAIKAEFKFIKKTDRNFFEILEQKKDYWEKDYHKKIDEERILIKKVNDLKEKESEINSEMDQLNKNKIILMELEDLKSDIEKSNEDINGTELKNRKLEAAIKDNIKKIDSKKDWIRIKNADVLKLKNEMDHLNKNKTILIKLEDLKSDIEKSNEEINGIELKNRKLEAAIKDNIKKIDSKKDWIRIKNADVSNLKNEINNFKYGDLRKLQKTLKERKNDFSELKNELLKIGNRLKHITNENKNLYSQIDKLNKRIEDFKEKKFEFIETTFKKIKTNEFRFFTKKLKIQDISNYKVSSFDYGLISIYKRYLHAINNIKKGYYKNPYLAINFDKPDIKNINKKEIKTTIELNKEQKDAAIRSINASCVSYIQGPPGTGKTQTIAAVAEHEVKIGNNVLITSSTHEAINNFFDRLSESQNNNPNIIYLRYVANDFSNKAIRFDENSLLKNYVNAMDKNILPKNDIDISRNIKSFYKMIKKSKYKDRINEIFCREQSTQQNISNYIEANKNIFLCNVSLEEKWKEIDSIKNNKSFKDKIKEFKKYELDRKIENLYEEEDYEKIVNEFVIIYRIWSSSSYSSNIVLDTEKILKSFQKKEKSNFKNLIKSLNDNIDSDIRENEKLNSYFKQFVINNKLINVIGITTTARKSIKVMTFEKELFSEYPIHYEIIDEVSKSTTPEIIASSNLSNRILLAGDYRQLPPFSDIDKELLKEFFNSRYSEKSREKIFNDIENEPNFDEYEKFINKLHETSFFKVQATKIRSSSDSYSYKALTTQHRFNEDIQKRVNLVYDDDEKLLMPKKPKKFNTYIIKHKNKTYNESVNLVDTSYLSPDFVEHCNQNNKKSITLYSGDDSFDQKTSLYETIVQSSRFNEYNEYVINKLIKIIIEENELKESQMSNIGIIAMTRSQAKNLKKSIHNIKNIKGIKNIKIDTVDNFQGNEKDLIIVDLVRAKNDLSNKEIKKPKKRNLDHYKKFERLNVAISRAKSKLIIVGAIKNHLSIDADSNIDRFINNRFINDNKENIFKFWYELSEKEDGVIKW